MTSEAPSTEFVDNLRELDAKFFVILEDRFKKASESYIARTRDSNVNALMSWQGRMKTYVAELVHVGQSKETMIREFLELISKEKPSPVYDKALSDFSADPKSGSTFIDLKKTSVDSALTWILSEVIGKFNVSSALVISHLEESFKTAHEKFIGSIKKADEVFYVDLQKRLDGSTELPALTPQARDMAISTRDRYRSTNVEQFLSDEEKSFVAYLESSTAGDISHFIGIEVGFRSVFY